MQCPICKKAVQREDLYMPFCSDRCRLQDLANWSTGKYVISEPINLEDGDEFLQGNEDDE